MRAPLGTSWQEIEAFISERQLWIEKKQAEFQAHYQKTDYQYQQGELHYFLGRPYCLMVYTAKRNQGKLQADQLSLGVHPLSRQEPALYAWYRQQAKLIFAKRCQYWFAQAQEKLAIHREFTVVIKRLKSRWGSYSTRGRINLNLELIRYPLSCLDMIICHELCHSRELNHSSAFFNDLTCLYPEWLTQYQLLSRLSMEY